MEFSKIKIDYIKVLIFLCFCFSIFSSKHNLSNYDQNKFYNNEVYHEMIKSDPHRHLKHGAEIKKDLKYAKRWGCYSVWFSTGTL